MKMKKPLYIAEKPSVAREFAKVLQIPQGGKGGYFESERGIVSWCVGHLITMSYPEAYGEVYKKWNLGTLPFLPSVFRYEVIPGVKKQFEVLKSLLQREDVGEIYVCTDAGREGEYIYRLVEQEAKPVGKVRKRVWIDAQTEEEIRRGIQEAKDLSEYDNLSHAAYLRAKEDYLMGINFSRLLTLKYGRRVAKSLGKPYAVLSIGRVMTCVLGMVVRREREIRNFQETTFYRVIARWEEKEVELEWRHSPASKIQPKSRIYKDSGFLSEEEGKAFCGWLTTPPIEGRVEKVERKKEKKQPPLLFNLAELQNECAKRYKISPDETLSIAQSLYEKKLITYPRTDARVLSKAVAKEIPKHIKGLRSYPDAIPYIEEIQSGTAMQGLLNSRYVNDKQITDHYAIIPTGQGLGALSKLSALSQQVYRLIVFRFLAIFYPPALFQKEHLQVQIKGERFTASWKSLVESGYLRLEEKKEEGVEGKKIRKGEKVEISSCFLKEGKTSAPKRYTSGSLILAMENAGQLIEDEELRAQIKGSGIGTSATRGEILKKLVQNQYLNLQSKTQVVAPTMLGELIFESVLDSIPSMLNPDLTASWEKGLTYVAGGEISPKEYEGKLLDFIQKKTAYVKGREEDATLEKRYQIVKRCYQKERKKENA